MRTVVNVRIIDIFYIYLTNFLSRVQYKTDICLKPIRKIKNVF